MRRIALAFLAAPAILPQQSIRFQLIPKETLEKRLGAAPRDNAARGEEMRGQFREAGCADLSDRPVRGSKLPNVICVLAGQSDDRIVVGAHYDKVREGDGVIDDWTGSALLASLYESMRVAPRTHTFVFVGFSDEERGLIGSKSFVRDIPREEAARFHAMVNMDSLGMGPTKVGVSTSAKPLVALAARVAQSLKLPIAYVNFDQVGMSDAAPFRDRKIPVIDFHSLTQDTLPILHSFRDRLDAVKVDDYYESYRLIVAFLALLDLEEHP